MKKKKVKIIVVLLILIIGGGFAAKKIHKARQWKQGIHDKCKDVVMEYINHPRKSPIHRSRIRFVRLNVEETIPTEKNPYRLACKGTITVTVNDKEKEYSWETDINWKGYNPSKPFNWMALDVDVYIPFH